MEILEILWELNTPEVLNKCGADWVRAREKDRQERAGHGSYLPA